MNAFQVNSLPLFSFVRIVLVVCACLVFGVCISSYFVVRSFVEAVVIICFSCRILFGTMTAPSSLLSSSLFVHNNRCCFLLYFDLLCTQHETITIASQNMPHIHNAQQMSNEQMSKSIIYYVKFIGTTAQPY